MRMPMDAVAVGVAILSLIGLATSASGSEATARQMLKTAFVAAAAKDNATAYNAVLEAINDPGFPTLEPATQHAALELAYVSAFGAKEFAQAHQFASRASALPQQSIEDWQYRLSASARINNYRDEAICITSMLALRGVESAGLTTEAVRRAYRDTRSPEFSEARRQMLVALYDRRWRPTDGASASDMWRSLSLLLLESNDAAKAAQVVSLIDEPTDVIAMRADLRYKPLLKSPYFESDPHQAARARIRVLRAHLAGHPRSLAALMLLTHALLTSREDDEALSLTTEADLKIVNSQAGSPPFDDIEQNHRWILNAKAGALRNLGRFEDALVELRRAVDLPHKDDTVSQPINLALLLCELDRPLEAIEALPKMEDASDYGNALLAFVELTAAVERGEPDAVRVHLQYLRDHQGVSPSTFQKALLIAGEFSEAEAVLLSRLSDPEKRTDALVELQTYSERKLPPRARAWHAEYEKLKTATSIRQAATRVGTLGRYTWRYE
jgi:tetratricopeptide (TPR) repeat protein